MNIADYLTEQNAYRVVIFFASCLACLVVALVMAPEREDLDDGEPMSTEELRRFFRDRDGFLVDEEV